MKLITFLLRESWGVVVLAILTGILSGAASAGLIATISALLYSASVTTVMVWIFVGLSALKLSTQVASQALMIHLTQHTIFKLRMHLSRQILTLPLRQLETHGAHRLLAVLTDDIAAITNALLNLPMLCIQLATVVVCLVYIGWLSWIVLLGTVVMITVGVITYQGLVHRAIESIWRAREEQDSLFKHFRSLTEGVKELKLHHQRREMFLSEVLRSTAATLRQHNVRGMTTYAAANGWGDLLFFLAIGLLIFVVPRLIALDNTTVIGCTLAFLYLMTPLVTIVTIAPAFGQADAAWSKIQTLGLARLPTDAALAYQQNIPATWQRLELIDVMHTYHRELEDSRFNLGPINLSFHPGELIFLVGGNGSGKTTFAKLLVGLYTPEAGEIRLDGQVITDSNRERYCQYFSVVFSDFYLFEQLLGLETPALDDQAHAYLARLQLDHKVQVSQGVLSTIGLSQGQRKRLALLTAYLEDRSFYVFDEWAADQDPIFKDIFYTQLLPDLRAKGKTILVITHDDKYFHLADRIIKLDYGQVDHALHSELNGLPA